MQNIMLIIVDDINDCKFICVEDGREGYEIDEYCKEILDELFPFPCKYEI